MEKLRNTKSLSKDKKARIVASFLVAGAILTSSNVSESKEPTGYSPIPNEKFLPLISYPDLLDKELVPSFSPLLIKDFLTKEEIQKQNAENQLQAIIGKMQAHKDIFKDKYIEDIKIYYPIYKEVADKFDIDWYLLFIVHEAETGASAGERGFAKDSYYKGAMQIDPNIWTSDYVKNATKGLEDLKNIPQRHSDDWSNIATAGNILADNLHKYENNGNIKAEAVLKSLLLYSADSHARDRFEKYKDYSIIFDYTKVISENVS